MLSCVIKRMQDSVFGTKIDLNEAVVEEEANSSRGRDGRFFEPLGSNRADKTFELRTFLGVVING